MGLQKARVVRILDSGKAEVLVHIAPIIDHDCCCASKNIPPSKMMAYNEIAAPAGEDVTIDDKVAASLSIGILAICVPILLGIAGNILLPHWGSCLAIPGLAVSCLIIRLTTRQRTARIVASSLRQSNEFGKEED